MPWLIVVGSQSIWFPVWGKLKSFNAFGFCIVLCSSLQRRASRPPGHVHPSQLQPEFELQHLRHLPPQRQGSSDFGGGAEWMAPEGPGLRDRASVESKLICYRSLGAVEELVTRHIRTCYFRINPSENWTSWFPQQFEIIPKNFVSRKSVRRCHL